MQQRPPDPSEPEHTSGDAALTRLGAGAVIVFLLITGAFLLLNPPARTDPDRRETLRTLIDVNSATRAELGALPNIGPALAERIASDREANGPFDSLDALDRVPGIGPRTIDSLRPFATAR